MNHDQSKELNFEFYIQKLKSLTENRDFNKGLKMYYDGHKTPYSHIRGSTYLVLQTIIDEKLSKSARGKMVLGFSIPYRGEKGNTDSIDQLLNIARDSGMFKRIHPEIVKDIINYSGQIGEERNKTKF